MAAKTNRGQWADIEQKNDVINMVSCVLHSLQSCRRIPWKRQEMEPLATRLEAGWLLRFASI